MILLIGRRKNVGDGKLPIFPGINLVVTPLCKIFH